jgi:hypothetical protein
MKPELELNLSQHHLRHPDMLDHLIDVGMDPTVSTIAGGGIGFGIGAGINTLLGSKDEDKNYKRRVILATIGAGLGLLGNMKLRSKLEPHWFELGVHESARQAIHKRLGPISPYIAKTFDEEKQYYQ